MGEHISFIQARLPSTYIEMQGALSLAGQHRLEHVMADIWPSYIHTLFTGRNGVGVPLESPEPIVSHQNSVQPKSLEIMQACEATHTLKMANCLAKDEAKKQLYNTLPHISQNKQPRFFLRWNNLAMGANLLPAGLDNFMNLDILQQYT